MLSTAAQRVALAGHANARVTRPVLPTGPKPSVSVVVPCYNYGHYLPGCVASILEQPGVDVEVIIVDDASPDGSAAVVREVAAADPRVRAIYHERNKGHIATYNDGLSTVRGEYLLLLSADDLLVPGALGRATALMAASPSVGLVYGATIDFTETAPPARTVATTWTVWPGRDWVAGRCRSGRNPLLSPEAVMRTSVFEKIGGYRADLPHSGDLAMWLAAAGLADVGFVGGADQAYYRVHKQSMSKTVNVGMVKDLGERMRAFDIALGAPDGGGGPESGVAEGRAPEGGAPENGNEELLELAHRALARQALEHAIQAHLYGVSDAESASEADTADAFVDVAFTIYPDVRALREWRILQRVRGAGPGARSASLRARELTRDLSDRVRWRRWRKTGV